MDSFKKILEDTLKEVTNFNTTNTDEFLIERMELLHLDEVIEIEKNSFASPWTKKTLQDEIENNKNSIYIVVLKENEVVGYAGMWHVVNEGHITNIAVKEEYRRKGIGSKIITKLIEIALDKEMMGITLEVRINNEKAQRLYTKFGFKIEGFRKNYYLDTKEDAVIMWKYLI